MTSPPAPFGSASSFSALRTWLLPATLLALAVGQAWADGGSPPRYRRPAQLQQPIEPTAVAHLSAGQVALQTALDAMGTFDSMDSVLNYGGYFSRAKADTALALAAVGETAAFVRAHPETDVLAAGTVPAGEPKAPTLPGLPASTTRGGEPLGPTDSPQVRAVDALSFALAALVNDPAARPGAVLGDLGGHRAKLIAAIGQIGTDLSNGLAYYKNVRGGATGIIPLSAPANLPPDPKFGPTARTYLAKVKTLLATSQTLNTQRGAVNDRRGGPVPPESKASTAQALKRALTDVEAALAHLDTHPDDATLLAARTTTKSVPTQPNVSISPSYGAKNSGTNGMIISLNDAHSWLANAQTTKGPFLGDLGGFREKIMDDIARALTETVASSPTPTDRRGSAPRGTPALPPATPTPGA